MRIPLPFRVRVPLYLGAGLAVVLATWTFVAGRSARHAARAAGEERAASIVTSLSSAYQMAAREFTRQLSLLARDSGLAAIVETGDPTHTSQAVATLRRALPAPNHRVTLFASDGTPLTSFPDSGAPLSPERHEELADAFAAAAQGPDFTAVGNLRLLDGVAVIPFVAATLKDGRPIGFTVLWRRAQPRERLREQLSQFTGIDGTVLLGNARGDLWADADGVHRFPVAFDPDSAAIQFADSGGARTMAMAKRVPGTPWAVAAVFREDSILAPANDFIERSAGLGLVLLVLATGAAWFLSRRITTPLHDLHDAATALAAGDYTRRVPVARQDELGSLGAAFNTMADRVAAAHRDLESNVVQRTQELKERNDELETFAHSISHDLRAPLRAMHGFSQALLDDCADSLDPAAQDYARRIAVAAQRMDLLTQDLLTYSKVSRAEMRLGPVDLGETVSAAVGQLEADISARAAHVAIASPLGGVVAHRASLEQTVANLVGNALKFVEAGTTPRVEIRAEPSNGVVRLWISDNGIGIDSSHHERIFSVFERLHSTDQFAGTGIGLAIVRKAVERMGGRVGLESAPGAGSRFWIELSRAESVA